MKKTKRTVAVLFAIIFVFSTTLSSFGCTGLYVGSDYSQNGSTYYGRSEDSKIDSCKIFGIAEARDWPAGSMYTSQENKFTMPMPSHTHRYTYCKDTPQNQEGFRACEAYGEVGVNEFGVSISATVSTDYNKAAEEADPLKEEDGICEFNLPSVILGKATTARDAVEYLAKIIDEYGSGECNSLMIGDANEVWYFEIVSGHQYAAVKLPSNKVSVQPNITLLRSIDVNDTENVIVSKNLVKLAEDHGFLQKDEQGRIDVAKTYAPVHVSTGCESRFWQGTHYLNAAYADTLSDKTTSDERQLLFDADRKLSTLEVLRLLAYRGEGTKYDSNKTGCYAIGNNRQEEVHVMEVRNGMPNDLATLQWLGMADGEFTIYLPYYTTLLTEVNPRYNEESRTYVEGSINWAFSRINKLCYDTRKKEKKDIGENIRKYFEAYQQSLIEQQPAIDQAMLAYLGESKELATQKANEIGKKISEQTFHVADGVLKELEAYIKKGNFDKPFMPSSYEKNVMPDYTFPTTENKLNLEYRPDMNEGMAIKEINGMPTYIRGESKGMSFKLVDGDFNSFLGVFIDGTEVDDKYYEKSEGSINIKFKKDFLDTLSVGEHVVKITTTKGYGEMTFAIADKPAEKPQAKSTKVTKVTKETSAKTGDGQMVELYMGLAIVAAAAICMIGYRRRQNR